VDWIHLAQDGDKWRALVNTVITLQNSQNAVISLSGCLLSSVQLHRDSSEN
jgi:hypothetical protein